MSVLVDGAWVQDRLGWTDVRIVEASIDKAAYEGGHIPGALWVDHYADLLANGDQTSGAVLSPGQFAALMSRLGIAPETTVVWYGDRHSSYAIRGLWTMDFYQHQGACYVLEGGRERWIAEGRPLEPKVVSPVGTGVSGAGGVREYEPRDVGRGAGGDGRAGFRRAGRAVVG